LPAFTKWLSAEMVRQNLSANALGEKCSVSGSQIANVLAGRSKPGLDFFLAVPDALKVDRVVAFRAAGILPSVSDADALTAEALCILSQITDDERGVVVRMLRGLLDGKG